MRIALLLTLMICLFWSPQVRSETDALSVQEQYDLGQKYLKRGYYTKAIEQFNIIRNYYRDDPMAQLADLAIADVYYEKAEWDLARYSYDDFRRRYPRHEKVDYATYQIGLTLYRKSPRFAGRDQTFTTHTIQSWTGFEEKYPNSEYIEDVVEKREECSERLAKKELLIAEFYERREAWESVRRRSEGLVTDYPDSQYASDAYALLVPAYLSLGDPDAAQMALSRLNSLDPDKAESLRKKYLAD